MTRCSGKSTLARALQTELDEPWLYLDLDTFPARLPPFPTGRPPPEVTRRMFTGQNAAVAAVVNADNDILLQLVARKDNPGASLVLADLFDRLAGLDVLVVCLRCTKATATRREATRTQDDLQGLVDRDYGNIDEESCDLLLDTDLLSVREQVPAVRGLLATGSKGGIDCLAPACATRRPPTTYRIRDVLGRALILTGPSGVGKTAVALRLQQLLADPWLFYEVDRAQPRLPDDTSQLPNGDTDNLIRRCLLRSARVYLDAGFSLIIEIGLSGGADRRSVEDVFAGVDLTTIVLTCKPETHERHLAARKGPVDDIWARKSYQRYTQPAIPGSLCLATDDQTVSQVARTIADHLRAVIRAD